MFGKPATLEIAYEMLEYLQGRTHNVVTAVCLLHLRNHKQDVFSESTAVTFRPLDAVGIRRYLNKVNPSTKRGLTPSRRKAIRLLKRLPVRTRMWWVSRSRGSRPNYRPGRNSWVYG